MCQWIGGDFIEFVNVLFVDKVVFDVYFYNFFNYEFFDKKIFEWNIDFVYNDCFSLVKRFNIVGNVLIFVGEYNFMSLNFSVNI